LIVKFAADGLFRTELFLDFVFGGGDVGQCLFKLFDAGIAVEGYRFETFEFGAEGAGRGFLG
jgi:hypothetical protein